MAKINWTENLHAVFSDVILGFIQSQFLSTAPAGRLYIHQ